ncbi:MULTISPECIES: heavy-metal-associated domain-containing protein [unclassified Paenibacillus]|uniref:heavy-metal-associated domain-containing protein n=1 Tax=unclassified Paenibacillus TaxID=185978 RepID=UPI001AE8E18D|nr:MULTISPECIES: heavy-metal-associated domain-containing protein [unclassified Paenibacillus]MBP1153785.1 copper chaperone CopZ [Paenibacillus sp. PvP091]MBP1170830.1 copper chaperone CopZ [Paenibacillus sp. PvR098]MBP2441858.1 copper chaperone CopZ [Paenibacillus sp. PvP052]
MIARTIVIQGMDDQEDVHKVIQALHEVWGIQKVEISLSSKEAILFYDETAASFRDFEQAVHELGFEVKTENAAADPSLDG